MKKFISFQNSDFQRENIDFHFPTKQLLYKAKPFFGILLNNEREFSKQIYKNGFCDGFCLHTIVENTGKIKTVITSAFSEFYNGYHLEILDNEIISFCLYDMGVLIENISYSLQDCNYAVDFNKSFGHKSKDTFEVWLTKTDISNVITKMVEDYSPDIDIDNTPEEIRISVGYYINQYNGKYAGEYIDIERAYWAFYRKRRMEQGYYENDRDFMPYYYLQTQMKEQVIKEDKLPEHIKYIAGVDVAYNELEQRMVGGIVVLDALTLEVVDKASHEMEITFPYVPGLFSFREIPPVVEAFKKLNIKPDLIVCDAQGIAHPKNVGMATHLGIELDIPTIGCAKKRLVGVYDKEALGNNRGNFQELNWNNEIVGRALRTQNDTNPMFVSIGHKISLETACEWVLKLCNQYRLPETTRQADQLVNSILKERTEYNLLED